MSKDIFRDHSFMLHCQRCNFEALHNVLFPQADYSSQLWSTVGWLFCLVQIVMIPHSNSNISLETQRTYPLS